jgi:hypothetical protein
MPAGRRWSAPFGQALDGWMGGSATALRPQITTSTLKIKAALQMQEHRRGGQAQSEP